MTADRIKEIQDKTAFPDSVSVCQALLQVWNECQEENYHKKYTEEDMKWAFETGENFQLTGEDNFNELFNSLNN